MKKSVALPGPDWSHTGTTEEPDRIVVTARYGDDIGTSMCACEDGKYVRIGSKTRRIHDVPRDGMHVVILLTSQRWRCTGCGSVHTPIPSGLDPMSRFTRRLVAAIWKLREKHTLREIAALVGITEGGVRNVLKRTDRSP